MSTSASPSPSGIRERLLAARRDLVDIGGRTRLLNTRLGAAGLVRIVGELADQMHRQLVIDGRPMKFDPAPEDPAPTLPESVVGERDPHRPPSGTTVDAARVIFGQDVLPPSVETHDDADGSSDGSAAADDGPLPHQVDGLLQTELPSAVLDKRLLKLAYDARTAQEEQGVNLLHLAVGFLRWREDDKDGAERLAPLLLIPVELERQGAGTRHRLVHAGDDVVANVSLQERLRAAFGIELPWPDDDEEVVPSEYMASVSSAIAGRSGWSVLPNEAALGLFSFTGFLMWRDLDPGRWPDGEGPDAHPLVEGLLGGRCPVQPPPLCDDDEPLDRILPPERCVHVLDADSSQAIAIAEVVHGRRSMVIQGPPGTGKSQTIANIVAAAIAKGRRVLFVAEKRAALEVVQRRLDGLGLGVACLELHSTRANRRAVLAALDETLQLGRPRLPDRDAHLDRLRATVAQLNDLSGRLHRRDTVTGRTLHETIGEVVRLQSFGHRWRRLRLDGADEWDAARRQAMVEIVRGLADEIRRIGIPQEHPWRGVGMESLLPTDRPRIAEAVVAARETLDRAVDACRTTLEAIGLARHERAGNEPATGPLASSCAELDRAIGLARHLADRPAGAAEIDGETGAQAWALHAATIQGIVERLGRFRSIRDDLAVQLASGSPETIADGTAARLRSELAALGGSPLRWLNPRWWALRRTMRELLATGAAGTPSGPREWATLLDSIVAFHRLSRELATDDALASRAFGPLWIGSASDPVAVAALARWIEVGRDGGFPVDPLRLADVVIDRAATEAAQRAIAAARALLEELAATLRLDITEAFGGESAEAVPTGAWRQRLTVWSEGADRLGGWIAWRARRDAAANSGLDDVCAALGAGRVSANEIEAHMLINAEEALMRRLDPDGLVLRTEGADRQRLRDEFVHLDRQRMALARAEVALAHFDALPAPTDSLGQMATIRRELVKRRRHLPIRRLLAEAGESVQRIRPVFMMSPPSVAQYLEPGRLRFDLVIMDEASQVRPVEALGAVARLAPDGQVVVVGDDRQLPPTAFFRAVAEDEAVDDDESLAAVRDLESVLGLCVAAGLPSRMLRWHYRSEHHSLIAVSNRAFYDSRLLVIPSPHERNDEYGLAFRHLPTTTYDRGGTGTNRGEAEAVADAVMEHARRWPDLTLGVGTFSVRQRDAILECMELRRRESPELEAFFGEGGVEPFFVKNLENIQGDERDVILISVGYGRTAEGYLTMNFGPVSQEGGQRRLNVLITRARRRCVVFSSITDDDIDLARASGLGPQALKMFLRYARLGELDVGLPTGRDFDSPFERQVAAAISGLGWQVESQVGVAGFFVDLAVRDPERPGRFLLGIECDGASYHSARWARDRDRLRQAVLESRGWRIHRIWSTDWFRRRDDELEGVLAALRRELDAARNVDAAELGSAHAASPAAGERSDQLGEAEQAPDDPGPVDAGTAAAAADMPVAIERDEPQPVDESPPLTEPYREARVRVPQRIAPHDVPPERLAEIVAAVVEQEGPLHEDELPRRIAGLWKLKRTGRRIDEATRHAIAIALAGLTVRRDGHFLQRPPSAESGERRPRRRDGSIAATLRRPEALPPSEIRALARLVVERHYGVSREALLAEMRRQFGFGALSAPLRSVLEVQVDALLLDGVLAQRGDGVFLRDD